MTKLFRFLTVLYIIFPLLVVPLIISRTGNWYYLFGIFCYYMGVILVAVHQKIILMVPLLFCLWFWITYGFSIHDYVFYLLVALVAGSVLYLLADQVQKFVKRTLPDNKETMAYDLKVDKMNDIVEQFRRANPNVKITPEIMDQIKNQAFFAGNTSGQQPKGS